MTVRITVVCEERASFECLGEFGLALHIDTGEGTWLFDTGMGETLVRNAARLELELTSLKGVVLSHGHLDHTGGLLPLLRATGGVDIYHHPEVFEQKFTKRRGAKRDVSLPYSPETLMAEGGRLIPVTSTLRLSSNLWLVGPAPMETAFESVDHGLCRREGDRLIPDPLSDELAAALITDRGLVALLGCAHRGPVNIVRHLLTVTGQQALRAVIGGAHLKYATPARIADTVHAFEALAPRRLAFCHCTGRTGEQAFEKAFEEGFVPVEVGTCLTFS